MKILGLPNWLANWCHVGRRSERYRHEQAGSAVIANGSCWLLQAVSNLFWSMSTIAKILLLPEIGWMAGNILSSADRDLHCMWLQADPSGIDIGMHLRYHTGSDLLWIGCKVRWSVENSRLPTPLLVCGHPGYKLKRCICRYRKNLNRNPANLTGWRMKAKLLGKSAFWLRQLTGQAE